MTLWAPARELIYKLSEVVSLDYLQSLGSECLDLANRPGCPCPSTLHLIAAVLFRLHNTLDSGSGTPLESHGGINAVTSYLGHVLERASVSGDSKEWEQLARIWKQVSTPPSVS